MSDGLDQPATLGDVRAAAQAVKLFVALSTAAVALLLAGIAYALSLWIISAAAAMSGVFLLVLAVGKMERGTARRLVAKLPDHHRHPPLEEQQYSNGDPVIVGGED